MKWKGPLDKQYLPKSGVVRITVQKNKTVTLHEPKEGNNLFVKLILKESARVLYVTGSIQTLYLHVTLCDKAHFEQNFSSQNSEHRKQVFILDGKKSQVQVSGSYALTQDKSYFEVVQLHTQSYASSSIAIKTVLDGTAQFEYRGTIKIEQQSHQTQAHQ